MKGCVGVLVVFGAGYTGSRVAERAASEGEDVLAVVRSADRAANLEGKGLRVTRDPATEVAKRWIARDVHAILCFPPDGVTDCALAPLLASAASVSYVSTTSVYGSHRGLVDDTTPVSDAPSARLEAEAAYRAVHATILRAPGIYAPDRGLHIRVIRGQHQLPGAGDNVLSRIHVDDLAALLLASRTVRGETFVVGDREPAPQREVVSWICHEYGCPMPPSVAPEAVPESLRQSRQIRPERALQRLNVTLRFPTYRDGMARNCTRIE